MPVDIPGVNPIRVKCTNCNSERGEKCTHPTGESGVRKNVGWFHFKREEDARLVVDATKCAPGVGYHVVPHVGCVMR